MDDMSAIYQQHARTVYKFLLAQCHDPDLAEELTQETFYQAVRSADRFDGGCKVSVRLCPIAKHLWYQHLRKRNRLALLPEEGIDTPLPPDQREVVYLRAFGGLSFLEIGDVLGKTETWARVTFYRSKEKLRNGGTGDEK